MREQVLDAVVSVQYDIATMPAELIFESGYVGSMIYAIFF